LKGKSTIELTYRFQLAMNWAPQADVQYIIHPGGNVANPQYPSAAIPDALVFGLRSILRF